VKHSLLILRDGNDATDPLDSSHEQSVTVQTERGCKMGRSDRQNVGPGKRKHTPGREEQYNEPSIYEHLALLNQHCSALADILESLGDQEALPKQESTYFRLIVEEVRASSSQSIMERRDEHEVQATADASKMRFALEKRLFGSEGKRSR
jgi:hypothetical protein